MNRCTINSIFNEVKKYKKEFFAGQIIAIISTILISVTPLFIPVLVDELLLGHKPRLTKFISENILPMSSMGYIATILFLLIALRICASVLSVLQTRIFSIISKDITYKLRVKLLDYLKKVTLKEYENFSVGEITSKLVTDCESVDDFIGSTISKVIVALLTLIFSTIILLWINWQLALFILITNPIVVFFTAKMSRNIGKLKKDANKSVATFQSNGSETLELFHQIKATNKEDYFFDKTIKSAKALRDYAVKYNYKSDMAAKWSGLLFLSGYEIFRAAGLMAVMYSDLSVGLMLAIFSYLWIMSGPTQDIINFQYSYAGAKASCERINEILSLEQEDVVKNGINPFVDKESISIELKNVTFSYKNGKKILDNINMKFDAGKKIAIVGASGSGKTTLANLIVGFYKPDSGEIFYDGIESKNIALSTIRENIHLILQQPKLFNDTIRFNLTLGESFSEDQIENAIELAQLGESVRSLDDGLDTRLGRDGIRLSGGQRQRVAMARMILHNPKVVIFDESTSALDTHTELKLFHDLKEFLSSKTVITIAHRLSTIQNADMIFVIENGELIDKGTPKELLAKENSYFANMK
ncbi:MAG: ABC transporter ATP-binding protein [Sulfurovaceae bacterium]|nr:ABC transporter ATP-binding protein [Sulfurovaceae bacterium]MDD5547964.1 ABC transporter ATP-binding protein [Sulfurovaceae bacterium]